MDKELVIAHLEVAAAKAKALAISVREGRLWEGELASGIGQIEEALNGARGTEYYRQDRRG